jgi:hypothetical protein
VSDVDAEELDEGIEQVCVLACTDVHCLKRLAESCELLYDRRQLDYFGARPEYRQQFPAWLSHCP